MSTARMNVWVTEVGDPCKIDLKHQWYVHVLTCDGELLRWCRDGREPMPYTNIETRCGHAEFDVPPGQYLVMATWSPSAGDPHQLGNHLTHLQVVRVNCGDHACVTLFPPTAHFCGTWFQIALGTLVRLGDVDRDLADRAIGAIGEVLQRLPQPPDPLTEATARLVRRTDDAT
jgi:hypothetical protein